MPAFDDHSPGLRTTVGSVAVTGIRFGRPAHPLDEPERRRCAQFRIHHRSRLLRVLASAPCIVVPLWAAKSLVQERRYGRFQIGIMAEIKSEQDDRLGSRGVLSQLRGCSLERLQPPKIVGEVENRTLEIGSSALLPSVRSRLRLHCAPAAVDIRPHPWA